ncbi:MAG: metal ABC transporter ATP-binding protein [Tannerella sp.]|jgi:zinc transport system ATP-binding protein|nr:metal ABC transporter ATP-binding protein [Tannerella sp.]
MEKLIEIQNITACYDRREVLQDVSLDLWKNDILGVTGPNGGGKTTLLKVMLGLLKPASGSVQYFEAGIPVSSLKMGYLPQVNPIDKRFPISVYEVVASGLAGEKPRFRDYTKIQKEKIDNYLIKMGLEPLKKRAIGELSGGQLQRTLLARAMVSVPEILILDEPDTFIDRDFEKQLYDFLGEISVNTAIVIVSHNAATLSSLVKHLAYVNQTLQYYDKPYISDYK